MVHNHENSHIIFVFLNYKQIQELHCVMIIWHVGELMHDLNLSSDLDPIIILISEAFYVLNCYVLSWD